MGLLTMLQALAKYYPRVSSCHPHHSPHGLVMASVGEGETEAGVGGAFHNRTASEAGVLKKISLFVLRLLLACEAYPVTGDILSIGKPPCFTICGKC